MASTKPQRWLRCPPGLSWSGPVCRWTGCGCSTSTRRAGRRCWTTSGSICRGRCGTLGSNLGQNSLTASSAGLSGSPVTFSAEGTLVLTVVRTVEVHNDFFLSLRNGSGHGLGFLDNYAVDTIPVGGAITWVWVGQNHNVSIAISGVNLSGNHSAPFTYSRTYTSAGTYFYRCTNHSEVFSYPLIQGMAGRIEVQ